MAERVAHHFVCHHSGVPRLSQAQKSVVGTGRLVHRSHDPKIPAATSAPADASQTPVATGTHTMVGVNAFGALLG